MKRHSLEKESGEEKKLYRAAKRRVYAKIGFYVHATVFAFSMPLLVFVNLVFTPHFWWFVFPLAGWSLGLAIQMLIVFVIANPQVREKMISDEIKRFESSDSVPTLEWRAPYQMPDWRNENEYAGKTF